MPGHNGGADRPRGPVRHRDGLDLAALASEVSRALTAVVAEVFDVQRTGLRHSQPVEPEKADQRVVSGWPRFHDAEDVSELGAGEPLGGRDPLDARSAHVEHRVPVQHTVDHRVAVEPRQGIQLAGDGGELPSGRLELSGEDLDLRPRRVEGVDPVLGASAEPLSQ